MKQINVIEFAKNVALVTGDGRMNKQAKANGTLQPGLDSNRELFIENHKKYCGKIMKLKKWQRKLKNNLSASQRSV